MHGKVDVDCGARDPETRHHASRGKGMVFRVVSYSWTPAVSRQRSSLYFFHGPTEKPALDFRPRFRLTGISAADFGREPPYRLQVSSCDRASVFRFARWVATRALSLFRLAKNRRARTFLAMTTAMENLATGVGPVKRERTEIVPVNNQGTSLPRKKFFRARAHCNPLSDSTFPVCVPSRRPSEPPPPPSNARVLPSRTRGRGGRALPRHLRTRARVARREFL